jgi:hypothetical protein
MPRAAKVRLVIAGFVLLFGIAGAWRLNALEAGGRGGGDGGRGGQGGQGGRALPAAQAAPYVAVDPRVPPDGCREPRPSGSAILVPLELDNLPSLGTLTKAVVERGTAHVEVSTNLPVELLKDLLPEILESKGAVILSVGFYQDDDATFAFRSRDGRNGVIHIATDPCGGRVAVTAELAAG